MPPKPKDDTVATRVPLQALAAVGIENTPSSRSWSGCGVAQFASGGTSAWCTASAALTRPAIPAADIVCPMFAFAEPSGTPCPRPASAARSAESSVLSPTEVPVPWAST